MLPALGAQRGCPGADWGVGGGINNRDVRSRKEPMAPVAPRGTVLRTEGGGVKSPSGSHTGQ